MYSLLHYEVYDPTSVSMKPPLNHLSTLFPLLENPAKKHYNAECKLPVMRSSSNSESARSLNSTVNEENSGTENLSILHFDFIAIDSFGEGRMRRNVPLVRLSCDAESLSLIFWHVYHLYFHPSMCLKYWRLEMIQYTPHL